MDRRNFFKIVSTVSAGVASTACGNKTSDTLIPLLVAHDQIPPGAEQWHPAVCTECAGGCGVIARIMEGERIIERTGQKFRERIACVKKLEGNPLDPVSGGRLCARGQASLQSLYNPDRVSQPMRRSSDRGKAEFTPISWDEAIATVADKLGKVHSGDAGKILFLITPQAGSRSLNIQNFLQSLGAQAALNCSVADSALEQKAASSVFGWNGLPRYDLANARYALGVGADFLGGWTSPVYYARQFGNFRQGRPGIRGKLVQAESRMSITAASADEWLPVRPGSEPQLLAAIARILLDEKLARNPDQLPAAVRDSFLAANPADAASTTGIEEKRIRRIARELGESEAPIVIAGASVVHTNSFDAFVAAHYLNLMLGNIGRPGGVLPPHASATAPESTNVPDALKRAQILLLDGANPAYTFPSASGIAAALGHIDTIISFGMFIDDSVAYADLILPSPHPLESGLAVIPSVSPSPASVTIGMPFIQPLYQTRPIELTLDAIARKMNVKFEPVTTQSFVKPLLPASLTWQDAARQGGVWPEEAPTPGPSKPLAAKFELRSAIFTGAPDQFPLVFQPYVSLQYHDGGGANLPWMQELPDPVSSSMWDLPVEVDPRTAARLNVTTGDWVRVESPHGAIEATAYVHPAAIPGVVSMAIGEGHTHYGRYASGRGANPLSIVAPVWEDATGALAFGATRVRITRLDRPSGLIQFSPNDREQSPWSYR
ncbi:MAG: molybdopterin-dependent oxidoreductase [Bryobacteraceae bacterium]